MNQFSIPRDIYYGRGSLEFLRQLHGKRATVVIGGGSMKKLGFLDKTINYLREAGLSAEVVADVEPDPSVETVQRGAKQMRDFQPDWIIGLGGGSAIDAAKAMWVFYEHPDLKFEDSVELGGVPPMRQKARFIAIPSTSGTASEVTTSAVISDYAAKVKYALDSKALIPDMAILDSELAEAMPAQLAAYTGMDALTHALEAYVATLANPFSDSLAIEATRLVLQNLEKSCAGDAAAREAMHYAQCMAGMAFSNSMLGITHSMAHATGLTFKLPHGAGNALFLPYVLQFNAGTAGGRYAALARDLHLPGNNDAELSASLWTAVQELNRKLKVAASLKEFGVERSLFDRELDSIVGKAMHDPCTETNPRPCSAQEMKRMFLAAWDGRPVDF